MPWLAATAYAAAPPILQKINQAIVNPLIMFLSALAFITFLYGVYEMVSQSDNETARQTGQQHMLWGVVGLFIMFSVMGILNVVCRTIGCN